MKKSDLKKYAKLIVQTGVNVQKNQEVRIFAGVQDAFFVEYLVEECYKRKASRVHVEWSSSAITRLNYKYQKLEKMVEVQDWEYKKFERYSEVLPAAIHILSDDPDALNDIDQSKAMAVRKATGAKFKELRDKMDNNFQWTIAAIPSEAWASKLFPNVSKKKAVELLWDAILSTARVYGDPIKNWEEHNTNIVSKCELLNNLNIKNLHYTSSNGTDFKVSLTGKTNFEGGISKTFKGVTYNPNMPTEECFTSPDPNTANGVVYSTKALSVMGSVVDNFGFRFENGKVVEVIGNDHDKAILEKLISIDEGASRLGEVALVPYDSPVNKTGILFYNTLFDENACCHLAIGRGFEDTIKDFRNKSQEELKAVGLNDSLIHVDFMIGSADLSIIAETFDNKTVEIFKDGTWAI